MEHSHFYVLDSLILWFYQTNICHTHWAMDYLLVVSNFSRFPSFNSNSMSAVTQTVKWLHCWLNSQKTRIAKWIQRKRKVSASALCLKKWKTIGFDMENICGQVKTSSRHAIVMLFAGSRWPLY